MAWATCSPPSAACLLLGRAECLPSGTLTLSALLIGSTGEGTTPVLVTGSVTTRD